MPGLELERVLTASRHWNEKIFGYKEIFLHAFELYLDTKIGRVTASQL